MKKIKIIEMGGTISAHGKNRLDLKDYVSGKYTNDDFSQAIPELNEIAEVSYDSFLNVSSTAITGEHWIQLRDKVTTYLCDETYDGIIITHGTNTLEETAYFLHLTVPSTKPIVFVGAQRPFTALSTDAHRNLLNAVTVATDDASHNKGVLVVLNDQISGARDVTKTNTYRLEAFQSGQLGFLGFIDPDDKVTFYHEPVKKHTIDSPFASLSIDTLPNVDIVYSYAGATGHLIEHITHSGKFSGIVTAGTGAGLISPDEISAAEKAMENGIVVVRSQRVGNGRVLPMDIYNDYPFIYGDNLLPQKARILLMLSLLKYKEPSDIQMMFNTF